MARGLKQIAQHSCIATLATLLVAVTPVASAAEGGLRCGLMVGGLPLSEKQTKGSEREKEDNYGITAAYLPGPQLAKLNIRTRILPQATPLLNERVWYKRSRLPAAITIANFGCTWI